MGAGGNSLFSNSYNFNKSMTNVGGVGPSYIKNRQNKKFIQSCLYVNNYN
jgi:hypothetical protein